MASSKKSSGNSSDLVPRYRTIEGELLNDSTELAPLPRVRRYDFSKEIRWTDEEFTQLDRATVEELARRYKNGLGTLVADVYLATRTWLPNNVIGKPTLMAWATRTRHAGKYRWLEVAYATAGGGTSVLTIKYMDRSTHPARKYRWFESMLHSSLGAGNWRKTVARELRKMHRQALHDLRTVTTALGHDKKPKALGYEQKRLPKF